MAKKASDRIQRQVVLPPPRDRVWRAVSNSKTFGECFGAQLAGEFTPGARVPATNDFGPYGRLHWDFFIDRMEPKRLISWRRRRGATRLARRTSTAGRSRPTRSNAIWPSKPPTSRRREKRCNEINYQPRMHVNKRE